MATCQPFCPDWSLPFLIPETAWGSLKCAEAIYSIGATGFSRRLARSALTLAYPERRCAPQ